MKRAASGLCLGAILSLFLVYVAATAPAGRFGRYHDDSIYFISAKALAGGRGYLLPSVPGEPPQTKYPILYPWLLSWIWRFNPSYPANVAAAIGLTALFSCWFLVVSFLFLRRQKGVGDGVALALVALCAAQPLFVFLSGTLLSDVPFIALALTAAVLADSAIRPARAGWAAGAAGALTGLAILTRTFGVAVAAGILAIGLYRRAWRPLAWYGAGLAPVLVLAAVWGGQAASPPPEGSPWGWRQTWLYYTSYAEFWRSCVPDAGVLWAMVRQNFQTLLTWPSTFCLFPPLGDEKSFAGLLLSITLSVGILAGVVRHAREQEWQPIHFIFVIYSGATLLWNYALFDRFLMLFLPMFFLGLWVEGSHVVRNLIETLRGAGSRGDKSIAAVMLAGVAMAAGLGARNFIGSDLLKRPSERGENLNRQKAELYEWIRHHTPPAARFIAYADGMIYLHTGRQAMRAIAFSTQALYMKDNAVLARDLEHITDVARQIGARYWVAAEDDFRMETGKPLVNQRMQELKSALPVVFESRGRGVQVYDLACLHQPGGDGCGGAATALLSRAQAARP